MIYRHPKFTDYGADKDGNIYSFKAEKIRIIKGSPNVTTGYLYFSIFENNIRLKYKACANFIWECITKEQPLWGNQSDSPTINHHNKIVTDNRFINLEKVTCRENVKHEHVTRQQHRYLPKYVYYQDDCPATPYKVSVCRKYVGYFSTLEEAQAVAQKEFKKIYPNETY